MSAATPALPPMLARMADPKPVCDWGRSCATPPTVEAQTLRPQHQHALRELADDRSLPVWVPFKPYCDRHLEMLRECFMLDVDGTILVMRRLVSS